MGMDESKGLHTPLPQSLSPLRGEGRKSDRERRQPLHSLPADTETLARGGKDVQFWAGSQQCLGQLRGLIDDLLAIVQNQQQPAGPEKLDKDVAQRSARLVA